MSGAKRGDRPRAVVTGIGLVTPVGRGAAGFFDAVCHGKSGLVRPPDGHTADGLVESCGIAPDIDPLTVVPRADAAVVDRYALMAVAAADDAFADAGLVVGEHVDPLRVACVVSSGAGGMETFEKQTWALRERGIAAVSPYLYAGFLPNMAAARIAIKYGIRGYSTASSTACAASAHAIADALRLIAADEADVVICGGSEGSLGPTGIAGFRNARALAGGWADPTTASRPFDLHRNGFVLGEGAGVLVIERAEIAEARGAAGWADLSGWGATTDAYHLVMPRPDGSAAAACMELALRYAGVGVSEVGYLNAHGTGTRIGDAAEARAIQQVFGADQPRVSSTKGVTGHLLGGAGVIEAAATVLALAERRLPPTVNLDDPDPKCELNHVRGDAVHEKVDVAVSNSFAFGGHNVSLVFTPPSTSRARRLDEPAVAAAD